MVNSNYQLDESEFRHRLSIVNALLRDAKSPKEVIMAITELKDMERKAQLLDASDETNLHMAEAFAVDVLNQTSTTEQAEQDRIENEFINSIEAAGDTSAYTRTPTRGIRGAIFRAMNPDEQRLFLNINPNAPAWLLVLDERGLPVAVDGRMQYMRDADGSPIMGRRVLDALLEVKGHTPDFKGAAAFPDPRSYEERIRTLRESIHILQAYEAEEIRKRNGGEAEWADLHEKFQQAHTRAEAAVEAHKKARATQESTTASDGERAKAHADFMRSQQELGHALQKHVLDTVSGHSNAVQVNLESTTPHAEKDGKGPLPHQFTLSHDGLILPLISEKTGTSLHKP